MFGQSIKKTNIDMRLFLYLDVHAAAPAIYYLQTFLPHYKAHLHNFVIYSRVDIEVLNIYRAYGAPF